MRTSPGTGPPNGAQTAAVNAWTTAHGPTTAPRGPSDTDSKRLRNTPTNPGRASKRLPGREIPEKAQRAQNHYCALCLSMQFAFPPAPASDKLTESLPQWKPRGPPESPQTNPTQSKMSSKTPTRRRGRPRWSPNRHKPVTKQPTETRPTNDLIQGGGGCGVSL